MSDPHGDPSSLDPTRDRYVRQRNAARSWSLAIVAVAVVLAVAYYLHSPFTDWSAPAMTPPSLRRPLPPPEFARRLRRKPPDSAGPRRSREIFATRSRFGGAVCLRR